MTNDELIEALDQVHEDVNIASAIVSLLHCNASGPSRYDYAFIAAIDKLHSSIQLIYDLQQKIGEKTYEDCVQDCEYEECTGNAPEWYDDRPMAESFQDTGRTQTGC